MHFRFLGVDLVDIERLNYSKVFFTKALQKFGKKKAENLKRGLSFKLNTAF